MRDGRDTTVDMDRIRADHGLVQVAFEDALWAASGHTSSLGTQLKQGSRKTWWAAVEWVLRLQHTFEDLTEGELLGELRKGPGSVFWPLLSEDPTMIADCPRCEHAVVIDKEGLCPQCAYEFEEEN